MPCKRWCEQARNRPRCDFRPHLYERDQNITIKAMYYHINTTNNMLTSRRWQQRRPSCEQEENMNNRNGL